MDNALVDFLTLIVGFTLLYKLLTSPVEILKSRKAFNRTTSISKIRFQLSKTYHCKTKCFSRAKEIDFRKRKKLSTITPSLEIHESWGTRSKIYLAGLNIFNGTNEFDEQNLISEAEDYVEQFWKKINITSPSLLNIDTFTTNIPEIYHYTWFNCRNFSLVNFISMISVLKVMSSENARIILHTDCVPENNPLFQKLSNLAGHFLEIQTVEQPKKVWDRGLGKTVHVSDVYRLLVLLKFGGIYCDGDMLLLKSHAEFLESKIPVISEESPASLANGFMMSPKKAKIFLRWLLEYKFYRNVLMGPFGGMKIWALWRKFGNEIHVEKGTMVRPNWKELHLIFRERFDWSSSYNIHVSGSMGKWMNEIKSKYNVSLDRVEDFDCMENTFGEIVRFIFYGSHLICR